MIKLKVSQGVEIVRMLKNYADEIKVAIDEWQSGDSGVQYLEAELAETELAIEGLEKILADA